MEDEELTVYINRNSYGINILNIPNLGVLEKLTEHYWIMNDEEFIQSHNLFKLWWGQNSRLVDTVEFGNSVLFNGKKCLIGLVNGDWIFGSIILTKDISKEYVVRCCPPRYSLITKTERDVFLKVSSDELKCIIDFKNPLKFEKILKDQKYGEK